MVPIARLAAAATATLCAHACTLPAVQDEPAPAAESSTTQPGPSIGFGLLAGGAQASDDTSAEDLSGGTFGGRLDLSFPVAESLFELGVRGSVSRAQLEPDTVPAGTSLELEATQAAVAPMFRLWMAEPQHEVRPYLEGFVGVHRTRIDTTGSALGMTLTDSESDSGLYGGLGVGVGIDVSERSVFVLGFEWARSKLDDLDAESDAFQAHVGARIRF